MQRNRHQMRKHLRNINKYREIINRKAPLGKNRHLIKAELHRKQNFLCACCKKKFKYRELTFDHIFPQSLGGSWQKTNLQLLCYPCNQRKGKQLFMIE